MNPIGNTPLLNWLNSMDTSAAENILQNGVQTLHSQNQQLNFFRNYKVTNREYDKYHLAYCSLEIVCQKATLFRLGLRFDAVAEKIRNLGEENELFKKCSDFQKDKDLLYELPEEPQRRFMSIAELQNIVNIRQTKIQEYENALSQLENYVREREETNKISTSVIPVIGNFFQYFNGGAPPTGDGSSQKAWSTFMAGVGTIFFCILFFLILNKKAVIDALHATSSSLKERAAIGITPASKTAVESLPHASIG